MTREELDSIGEAMDLDERKRRDVAVMIQAEEEAAKRARRAQYRCDTDGCSVDTSRPWSCCDNCLTIAALERKIDQLEAALAALEHDQSPWHVRTASGEKYFAKASDAAFWRKLEAEKLRRHLARVRGVWQRAAENDYLDRRYEITDDGRRALAEHEAADPAKAPTARTFVDDTLDAIVSMTRINAAIVRGELASSTPTEAA